ncbi:MAG TPA: FtsX-like permease family protein, partial [Pseudosphingobacterium sp.]|nr:FtsX-like permease family protein [Pseudosphingobacterium sp.]
VAKFYGKFKKKLELSADLLKNEFLKNPDILTVARTSNIIGDGLSIEQIWPTNNPEEKEYGPVKVIRVDEDYLTALNIKLKEGRNFSRSFNDSTSFILNEKAVEALELQDPINKSLTNHIMNKRGNIIGVIKNYNFESLHHQIEPLVLEYNPQQTTNIFIKIKGDKTIKTVDFIRAKIKEISPGTLFSYSFLDEKISRLYQKESNMGSVLFAFTTLGIIISCLGLLGLIAYTSEMRTKEIGIRKIIGASIKNLVSLLSKDILLLVLIGNSIAWPLSWYLINKWLDNFAYKISIPWWIFGSSMLMTLSIALFTVIWHCLKTALANPVNSLRNE